MNRENTHIVVAGHVCLDIIPTLPDTIDSDSMNFIPGQLINVGPAMMATGGAVPNSGIALHRLGLKTTLMGKIGDDLFGQAILTILQQHDPSLAESMIVSPNDQSSYSIVISTSDTDRIFLHYPGANDTFSPEDLSYDTMVDAQIFHFGYPPLMKYLYQNNGQNLTSIFSRVKKMDLTSSLDMTLPDSNSESGQVDWQNILKNVLPHVDIFSPSLDEILFMLFPDSFDSYRPGEIPNVTQLSSISSKLIEMGAAITLIKLGSYGLYMRTTPNPERLSRLGKCKPNNIEPWLGRELFAPTYSVDVAGTTGAGDSTIAGFLTGFSKDLSPEECLTIGVATGACSVEKSDATSGIPTWDKLMDRINSNWPRNPTKLMLPGWLLDPQQVIWSGTNDYRLINK